MLAMPTCRHERHFKSVRLVLEGVCMTQVWHTYGNDVTYYNHSFQVPHRADWNAEEKEHFARYLQKTCFLFTGNMFWIMFVESYCCGLWMCKFYIVVHACHFLKLLFDIGWISCVITLLHMILLFFFHHPPLSLNWVCCPVNCILCLCMSLQFIFSESWVLMWI